MLQKIAQGNVLAASQYSGLAILLRISLTGPFMLLVRRERQTCVLYDKDEKLSSRVVGLGSE
jgi:hypothetical protein